MLITFVRANDPTSQTITPAKRSRGQSQLTSNDCTGLSPIENVKDNDASLRICKSEPRPSAFALDMLPRCVNKKIGLGCCLNVMCLQLVELGPSRQHHSLSPVQSVQSVRKCKHARVRAWGRACARAHTCAHACMCGYGCGWMLRTGVHGCVRLWLHM